MDTDQKKELQKIANTVRGLSIDAIEKARSGHPGLPLGCAEIGAYLFSKVLNYSPKNSKWVNRDRFVLSAGHGSMLLYSLLHLSGFDVSLDQIRSFRQLDSKTPGHPEVHITDGVEATTGPLGHGIGNSVGMALGMKILKEKFNSKDFDLFNNKIYCLAGDGCMMEGAASEASSLAGHLGLDNLVIIYDANNISLDGPLDHCMSEDVKARYRSYKFDVFEIDGHNFDAMDKVFSEINGKQDRPTLIIAHTIIGKGAPNKSGTHKVHGSPLGEAETYATKKALDIPSEEFYVPQVAYDHFDRKKEKQKQIESDWNNLFQKWAKTHTELFEEFKIMQNKILPEDFGHKISDLQIKSPIASRSASSEMINLLADMLPFLYSGSADLSSSDMSNMKNYSRINADTFSGRNIKYGVREFAMGTISNGLALTEMILPICGTFLVFSDYLKNAIRLAALSNLQVVYQFTHDSIFLGEDGPTHQPVEQVAGLRAIPNLHVIRPADATEVKMAWIAAMNYKNGPTALILSRQALPTLDVTNVSYEEGLSKGAYIVKKEKQKPDFTFFATGSELVLALDVAISLEKLGKDVRVISMPCFELFEKQPKEYRDLIVKGDLGKRVSFEALTDFGWHKYIGIDGIAICVDEFGKSAPIDKLKEEYGFTVDSVLQRLI